MKVNETKNLGLIGVYKNTYTGKNFEAPIVNRAEYILSPSNSATIDNIGNIKILNDNNREIEVRARYNGKESSMTIYVEEEQGGGDIDVGKFDGMISAGYVHTIALKKDGTVWAWGSNGNGELGDGTNKYSSNTPVQALIKLW